MLLALVNEELVPEEKHYSFTKLTISNGWTLSWMEFTTMALVPAFLLLFFNYIY